MNENNIFNFWHWVFTALLLICVVVLAFSVGHWKQYAADQDAILWREMKVLKAYVDNKQPEIIIIPDTIIVPDMPDLIGGIDG